MTFESHATVNFESNAGSNHVFKSTNAYFYPTGDFQVDSTTAGFNQSDSFYIRAGMPLLKMESGIISFNNGAGSSISLVGAMIVVDAGGDARGEKRRSHDAQDGRIDGHRGGRRHQRVGAHIKLNG